MNEDQTESNAPVDPNQPPISSTTGTTRPRELTSAELLNGQPEVCIRHGDEIYRLRATKNGKLVLHK